MFEGFSLHEILKLSPRYLLPVAIVTGFLTLGGETTLDSIGLKQIRHQYRPWISLAFLASTAVVVGHLVTEGSMHLKKRHEEREAQKNALRRLHNLTTVEKVILARYIDRQTRTQNLDVGSGVVNGLEHEGIIYRASQIGHLDRWPYNIQPWAWKYLNKHRHLLLVEDRVGADGVK